MTSENKNETLAALKHLRSSGQLSNDLYGKEVVKLSAEYAAESDVKEALSLLRGLPISYFEGAFLHQMIEDEDFCNTASEVASLIGESKEPRVNMAPGEA